VAALLVARGVDKIYRTGTLEVPALRQLDFEVESGELVAVMGRPVAGSVTIGGRDLFAMSDSERTRHRATAMGFVFQAFNLIPFSSTPPAESDTDG
jgi:putative ABC transport system ATP-binding protein